MKKNNIIFVALLVFVFVFNFLSKSFGTSNVLTDELKIKVMVNGEVKMPGTYFFDTVIKVSDVISKAGGFTLEADQASIDLERVISENEIIEVLKLVEEKKLLVQITGEVNIPGIYEVSDGTRVFELIQKAGGLKANADISKLNRTKILKDGELVNILKLKELVDEEVEKLPEEDVEISVYISGEVRRPGVYLLKKDSRLNDLVEIAGGFSLRADKTSVNLAAKVKDGEMIVIERIIEVENKSDLINLNFASYDALLELPGIGEVYAKKIIDWRKKSYFTTMDQVKELLGNNIYEKIKNLIEV